MLLEGGTTDPGGGPDMMKKRFHLTDPTGKYRVEQKNFYIYITKGDSRGAVIKISFDAKMNRNTTQSRKL